MMQAMRRCFLLTALTSVAHAQSIDELDDRTKGIVRRMNATTQVEQRYGRLVRGREAFAGGPRSISSTVGSWQEDAHDWILRWMRIIGLAELREELSYDVFLTNLTDLLRTQAEGLEGLRRRAVPLAADTNRATLLFGSLTEISDVPELAPYRQVIDRMLQAEQSSRAAAERTRGYLGERLAEIERIDAVSRRLISARLEAALIERAIYPLQQTLDAVAALLAAEAAVDPSLARLGAWERDLNQHAIKLHVFHARRAIDGARRECAEVRAAFERLHEPVQFVRTAREHAERLCRASESHYAGLNGLGVPAWEIVAEILRVERVDLQSACVRNPSPALGCERLAVLAALDDDALRNMTDAELDFVETEWVRELANAKGDEHP